MTLRQWLSPAPCIRQIVGVVLVVCFIVGRLIGSLLDSACDIDVFLEW